MRGTESRVVLHGKGYLAEPTLHLWTRSMGYMRGEIAHKQIIGTGGRHPVGVAHPHIISTVGMLMGGYTHEIWRSGSQHAFFVGADVTSYRVPSERRESYGRPLSVHLFGRWVVGFQ